MLNVIWRESPYRVKRLWLNGFSPPQTSNRRNITETPSSPCDPSHNDFVLSFVHMIARHVRRLDLFLDFHDRALTHAVMWGGGGVSLLQSTINILSGSRLVLKYAAFGFRRTALEGKHTQISDKQSCKIPLINFKNFLLTVFLKKKKLSEGQFLSRRFVIGTSAFLLAKLDSRSIGCFNWFPFYS